MNKNILSIVIGFVVGVTISSAMTIGFSLTPLVAFFNGLFVTLVSIKLVTYVMRDND